MFVDNVPFALRSRVEAELDRLENCGVFEPVSYSEWAAPIVPVVKQDGSIRICGDFRVTINQVAQRDMYPLPKVEDLLSTLAGGNAFSKPDLRHAYQQIQLSKESRKLVTINTSNTSIVSVHPSTFWDLCSSVNLPKNHGKSP